METPVNLVLLRNGGTVKIHCAVDINKPVEFVFSVSFDGAGLQQDRQPVAA